MRTEREYGYWLDRATRAGLTQVEITTYSMRSSEDLPYEVRQREEMQRTARQKTRENKVSVEGNTLEFSVAFAVDPAEHYVEVRRVELKNGNYLEMWSPPTIGQPTEFDLKLLLAIFKIAQENGYQEYEATSYQLARVLGYSRPSSTEYGLIRKGLERLIFCTIKTNNWYNPDKKKRVSLAAFNFLQKYEYDADTRKHHIRFSEWVEQSIGKKYLKQIDYDVARRLQGASTIIHLNLKKLIGNKKYFEISEELVLRWLGRWAKYQKIPRYRYNDHVKRFIDPSVQKAVRALGSDFELEKRGRIYQIRRIEN